MGEGRERVRPEAPEAPEVRGPEAGLSKDQQRPAGQHSERGGGKWDLGARGELGLILSTVGNPGGFQSGGVACFQGMAVASVRMVFGNQRTRATGRCQAALLPLPCSWEELRLHAKTHLWSQPSKWNDERTKLGCWGSMISAFNPVIPASLVPRGKAECHLHGHGASLASGGSEEGLTSHPAVRRKD